DDRLLKEPTRLRIDQQRVHRGATARLAEYGNVAWIAAKGRDIALHPFERGYLIHEGEVALRQARACQGREREEAEVAEPVIEADQHDSSLRESAAIVHRGRGPAVYIPASIDPHHHRQRPAPCGRGTPDVDVQTIFARSGTQRRRIARRGPLHAIGSVLERRSHA